MKNGVNNSQLTPITQAKNGFSIINQSTNDTTFSLTQQLQNNNYYLYRLYSSYQPFGISYQQLTFTTNDNDNHTYQFITGCNDVTTDNLVVLNETKSFYLSGYFYYYISISGIEPYFPSEISVVNSLATIKYSYDPIFNYFVQLCSNTNQNLTEEISLTLKFSNRLFPFKLKSYYSEYN
ncbi:hypothetical protein ACTA71_008339 [Dictyostelium dimigraforme]